MDEQLPPLQIRRGMDVYTSYQDRYLGEVVKVWHGGTLAVDEGERNAGARQTGSSKEATDNPELRQEQGSAQSPTRRIGRQILGEEEGPVPTMHIGNAGPVNQSAAHEYATQPRDAHEGVIYFAVRPSRYNPLAPRFYIPTSAVTTVSMERIVVNFEGNAIPDAWRRRPS